MNDEDQIDSICPISDNSQLINIKNTERNKFFGSLPNHLDSDETYREHSSKIKLNYLIYKFINSIHITIVRLPIDNKYINLHCQISLQQRHFRDTETSVGNK